MLFIVGRRQAHLRWQFVLFHGHVKSKGDKGMGHQQNGTGMMPSGDNIGAVGFRSVVYPHGDVGLDTARHCHGTETTAALNPLLTTVGVTTGSPPASARPLARSERSAFTDHDICTRTLSELGFSTPNFDKLSLSQLLPDASTYVVDALQWPGSCLAASLRAQSPEALGAIRVAVQSALKSCICDGLTEVELPAVLVSARKL